MSDPSTCPDCDHPKGHHGSLVGCLHTEGDYDTCDCDRSFKEDKSREQMTAERDQAMGQAEQGTDPDWAGKAEAAVLQLARSTQTNAPGTFTPDDVWVKLEELRVAPPREPRALGPILKRMANAKVIRAVGFTESRRRHGAPVRIYEAGPNL
jgi:hypothetical protein